MLQKITHRDNKEIVWTNKNIQNKKGRVFIPQYLSTTTIKLSGELIKGK